MKTTSKKYEFINVLDLLFQRLMNEIIKTKKMELTRRFVFFIVVAITISSCSLEKNPISDFSELNVGGTTSSGSTVKFKTRDEMLTQYNVMYTQLADSRIESWILDLLIYTDTHADNSYRGATDLELAQLEQQKQNGNNKNINRDWDNYFGIVGAANSVICNIDSVPDATLTVAERKQWKAEALILRSMIYFDLVRLWGDVPLVLVEPPAITAANIKDVYPLYFPKRDSASIVYRQIIKDLNTALEPGGAPDIDNSNKFKFSKTVANALLAKIYAEKPVRDYQKVISYCKEVEKDVSLVPNYGDLFNMNTENTNVKNRSTSESIFEISFAGGGNWITWMCGIDLSSATSTYDWKKWFTPSRDLIAAFDKAGDTERKKQTIVYADVKWSLHYPGNAYPFMYKYRSKFHSFIKMRLADILLLEAEANILKESPDIEAAKSLVNKIRTRAKLPSLTTVTIDDVLNERRLELAFEGHRWFDLVRTGKVIPVMNGLNSRDSGRLPMNTMTDSKTLLPIPQAQIDKNPSMSQNLDY